MPLEERVKRILDHVGLLQDERRTFETTWQDIADHVLGRRDFPGRTNHNAGRQRGQFIYDTTARNAQVLLAAALHSLLTNPSTRWFDLEYDRDVLNHSYEAMAWLDAVRNRMAASFRASESGFDPQMHEFYTDLTGFNTACIYQDVKLGFGPVFSARPLSEIFFDEDQSGRIVVVYRKFELRHWQAMEFFGDEVGDKTMKLVAQGKGNGQHEYLHCVRKREFPTPGRIDAEGKPWESIYINLDEKRVVREGGFDTNPYHIARWSKDAGERYGRGPMMDIMADAKMLNAVGRSYVRSAEKSVDPPVIVTDESLVPGTQLRMTPSARINVRDEIGGNDPVRYLEHRGRFEPAEVVLERTGNRIEKAFHSEIIQAFQDPRMTATQVIELARLSQRLLSPVLGRMQVEVLEPLLERDFGVLDRMGQFPPAPDIVVEAGATINIEYVSPVARAQKAGESQAITDTLAMAAGLTQLDPSVMDNFDLDVAMRTIADGNSVDHRILRPPQEVIELRAAQAELQAQQRQIDQGAQLAGAASDLIPALVQAGEAAVQ